MYASRSVQQTHKKQNLFDKGTKRIKLTKRKKEAFMGKQKISTAVRMLCDMRQKLEESAAEHGRTLSGEIVYRLRKSLEEEANGGKNQQA